MLGCIARWTGGVSESSECVRRVCVCVVLVTSSGGVMVATGEEKSGCERLHAVIEFL